MTSINENTPNSAVVKADSALRIYGVVLSIGVACSVAIVATYEVTRPIIRANRLEQRQQAIMNVVSGAETAVALLYVPEMGQFMVHEEDSEQEPTLFAGYSGAGQLTGFAIPARGMGYQDTIRLLYGYDPDRQTVMGIRILESRETPGLGDRIETDAAFLANFEQLDVRVKDQNGEEVLEHSIEFVAAGEKTKPWQVDGITGATISSEAVANILEASTQTLIPRLRRCLGDLKMAPDRSADR